MGQFSTWRNFRNAAMLLRSRWKLVQGVSADICFHLHYFYAHPRMFRKKKKTDLKFSLEFLVGNMKLFQMTVALLMLLGSP
jgi:hypothetical protein